MKKIIKNILEKLLTIKKNLIIIVLQVKFCASSEVIILDIRESIKIYLAQQGITIKWLANSIHMNNVSLSETLNKRRELKAPEYFEICNALRVPYDTFAPKSNDGE